MAGYFPSTRKLIKLSYQAMEEGDVNALTVLSESIPATVADSLNESNDLSFLDSYTEKDISPLFFRVGHQLDLDVKDIFMNKLVPKILKQAEKMYSLGLQARMLRYLPYEPGNRWDTFLTIEKMLSLGEINTKRDVLPSYDSIVSMERERIDRLVILLIDKSHSVYLRMGEITLLSAILSFAMQKENYTIIAFDKKQYFIRKTDTKPKNPASIISSCLALEASGKTDINKALIQAVQEIKNTRSRLKKLVVLISDLVVTEGTTVISPEVRIIEDLRVIKVPEQRAKEFNEFEKNLRNLNSTTFYHLNRHVNILKLANEILYT
ncbi:MAG: vWA domain-containing protein [Candidatus Hodarchaeales archaeon]|jgi:hypothetical protein